MNELKVSVILASYNYGRFIEESIDSILRQSYPQDRIEIIVVDDGSTDDTAQRLKKYGDRIRYIYKQNGGHASALNMGYANSKGDVIAFLDPDDYWADSKIEKILYCYRGYEAKAVFNNSRLFGEGVSGSTTLHKATRLKRIEKKEKDLFRLTLSNAHHCGYYLTILSGQSYSREIARKIFPMPEDFRYFADHPLRILSFLYNDIYYFHTPLTYYRQHAASHMSSLSYDIAHKKLEFQLNRVLVRELEKHNMNGRANHFIETFKNNEFCIRYEIEMLRGNKVKAFKYLKYLKCDGGFIERWIAKLDLILQTILPSRAYAFMKQFCAAIGLKTLYLKARTLSN